MALFKIYDHEPIGSPTQPDATVMLKLERLMPARWTAVTCTSPNAAFAAATARRSGGSGRVDALSSTKAPRPRARKL